ncbi:MAG: bacteriophage CI repressor [Bacteroidales bacterium]|nr:bacteriophage CI repressor [Bacteroidales bacterium]
MQKQNQHNVDLVLQRLKSILKADTNHKLAESLNVSPQVISNWKSRKTIDYPLVIEFAKKKNIDLGWLFSNEPDAGYPELKDNKQYVNDEAGTYTQNSGCKTCQVYEKVFRQFELIIQQQGKTIELLRDELDTLRKLYEVILKKTEDGSR